jgi:RNA polymerase sigma-70 factor (ECF subfamily)
MPQSNQERFVALLEQHRKILFKIASSYARQAADREDLVQEMVFQMWRSFDRYHEDQPFPTWMYRVALNVAISFYRRETRRKRVVVTGDESILELAAAPEAHALLEDFAVLKQLIEGLGDFDRALVILYLDGNPQRTMAEILGISESNVGTRLSRIKQKLRDDYERKERQHGTR